MVVFISCETKMATVDDIERCETSWQRRQFARRSGERVFCQHCQCDGYSIARCVTASWYKGSVSHKFATGCIEHRERDVQPQSTRAYGKRHASAASVRRQTQRSQQGD